jgi:DNA-binding transcriptional MerR regulator
VIGLPVENWLELSEAAEILSVHPSTLRRWADSGKVHHRRTQSGRRQFDRFIIENTRKGMLQVRESNTTDQIETSTREFASQHIRNVATWQQSWFSRLNEEQMMIFRYSGQRLLGLMMQYISRNDEAETFLDEAKRIARDYGTIFFRIGLSVSQAAEAFVYFRRPILESVLATAGLGGIHDPEGQRIFLRTSDFYDALLVSAIESYTTLSDAQ